MTNSSATPSSIHHNVVPSEVGWQFVPQYYTFVNKQPDRLHCFYTKTSTFIHGTEGEDGKPCYGQQEIHNKITSIGFKDCKVFIHSVDAQSSANGGIIIQVIGEMSNHNDPWRKFVQTFFLAEQPNGYFVLNDIFRFLKEETVEESDEASETGSSEPAQQVQAPTPVPAEPTEAWAVEPPVQSHEPQQEPEREPSPAPVAPDSPAPPAEELPTPAVAIPEPAAPAPGPEPITTQPNGIHDTVAEAEPEPAPAPLPVEKSPDLAPAQPATPAPAPPAPQQPPATSSPAPPPPAAAAAPPPAAPAPTPAAPPAPKTWANLAAANSKKWGSAVAQESRGTTEVPAATSSPGPGSGAQTPSASHSHPGPAPGRGPQHGGPRGEHPAIVAAQNVTTAACFVKGVTEPVSQTALNAYLTSRFGAIKELEIVRTKACAFLEFVSIDSAKKAIITSLPQSQGGEGGIRVDVGGEAGQVRISVETRKERSERPVSRPRGGAPVNGEPRGSGFRGRGGPRGGGRGAGAGPGAGGSK